MKEQGRMTPQEAKAKVDQATLNLTQQGERAATKERDPEQTQRVIEATAQPGNGNVPAKVEEPKKADPPAEKKPDIPMPVQSVVSIARMGEGARAAERLELKVQIQPWMQYVVGKTLGITGEGYLYINRLLGVEFRPTEKVPDAEGNLVLNPIHKRDYIYLRLAGWGYNDVGQLSMYVEDVEIDFLLRYQSLIVHSYSYMLKGGTVQSVEDDEGSKRTSVKMDGAALMGGAMPEFTVDEKDVIKAQRELYRLRNFGLRAAFSVAQIRILKQFTGIKSLPWQKGDPNSSEQQGTEWDPRAQTKVPRILPKPHPVTIGLVAYRDQLTPDERFKRAMESKDVLFTPRPVNPALSDDEEAAIATDAEEHPTENDVKVKPPEGRIEGTGSAGAEVERKGW